MINTVITLQKFSPDWAGLWMKTFGTTEWCGVNMGFWVSMAVVALVVVLQNIIFWNMKPTEHALHVREEEKKYALEHEKKKMKYN